MFMLLAIAGSIYLFALAANTLAEHQYIGRDVNSQTTISVSGEGEVSHAPDIAAISFSITNDAKTAAAARTVVDTKMKAIHDYLVGISVAEKDIKTTGYDLYPKYEYQRSNVACPLSASGAVIYCPPEGKQILVGYTITQSVDLKIHDLDKVADILGVLADKGASNVNGPTFTIDNPDTLQTEAREQAIEKAQAKAKQLAQDLGVQLVRVVSFNEGGNFPVMYNYAGSAKLMSADSVAAPAPVIPVGENKITSSVTIVYEIR